MTRYAKTMSDALREVRESIDETVLDTVLSISKGGSRYKDQEKDKDGKFIVKDRLGKVITSLSPAGAKKFLDSLKDPISGKGSVDALKKDRERRASRDSGGMGVRTRGTPEKNIVNLLRKFKEDVDIQEDGHDDVASAIRQCKTVTEDAMQILQKLQTMSPEGTLPTWWSNKLAIASNSMNKIRDYLLVPSIAEGLDLNEKAGDHNDLKKLVGELQNASKMHLAQSKRVKAHVDMMKAGDLKGTLELVQIVRELEKASEAHLRQSKAIANHMKKMGESNINEQMEAEDSLKNWKHDDAKSFAEELIEKYGKPNEVTQTMIKYNKLGAFGDKEMETYVIDESIPHSFPDPHRDFVYTVMEIKVPSDMLDTLGHVTGSIVYDGLKETVTARCGSLEANALTLQFVKDLVDGKIENDNDVAKKTYAERIRKGPLPKSFTPEQIEGIINCGHNHKLDEALKYTHAVVDPDGKVAGMTTNEKDAKDIASRHKGKVVMLKKPMSQKKGDMMINRPFKEEVELDEKKRLYRVSSSKMQGNVHAKDEKEAEKIARSKGMKGKLTIQDRGEYKGQPTFEKYDLYHSTFSGAMQHAYDYAKKKLGITVDPKEIDNKVATGPRKPSEGKTNKYRLKGKGGNLQIQVYNKGGSKPFELNMYKEENEMNEGNYIVTYSTKGKLFMKKIRAKSEDEAEDIFVKQFKDKKIPIGADDIRSVVKETLDEKKKLKPGAKFDFRLFDPEDSPGSDKANDDMNKEIQKAVRMKDKETARQYMMKVQKKHSKHGATDTEPREVINQILDAIYEARERFNEKFLITMPPVMGGKTMRIRSVGDLSRIMKKLGATQTDLDNVLTKSAMTRRSGTRFQNASGKMFLVKREEVELGEGYESEVLKVLKDADIDGYFKMGKLYVSRRDAKDAKKALEDSDEITKLPPMVKEENDMTKNLKETIMDMWKEAVSPAQQAAIAISKKEKEKDEGNAFGAALEKARKNGDKTFTVAGKEYDVKTEKLVGGQKKLDKDNDGDIDGKDFAMLRKQKKNEDVEQERQRYLETKKGSVRESILKMWGEISEKVEKKDLTKNEKDDSVKKTDTGKEMTPVDMSPKMPKVKESKNKV